MTRSSSGSLELRQCRFCEKPPGSKVGPPAMARCITPGCDGTKLAAETIPEWNARNLVETTCYVERSKVREILLSEPIARVTERVLCAVDALPIFVAADFRGGAQASGKPSGWPASLPPKREVQKLIDDFIAPDLDTEKAFATHRRSWMVQCLQALLTAYSVPSTSCGGEA